MYLKLEISRDISEQLSKIAFMLDRPVNSILAEIAGECVAEIKANSEVSQNPADERTWSE